MFRHFREKIHLAGIFIFHGTFPPFFRFGYLLLYPKRLDFTSVLSIQRLTGIPLQIIRRDLIYVKKQLGSTNHILIFPLFKPFSSTLYSHSIFCYSYYTPIYPMRINLSEDKTSFCFLYSRSKRCSAKSSLESSIISSLLSNLSISSDKWFSSTWVYKSIVICNVA